MFSHSTNKHDLNIIPQIRTQQFGVGWNTKCSNISFLASLVVVVVLMLFGKFNSQPLQESRLFNEEGSW